MTSVREGSGGSAARLAVNNLIAMLLALAVAPLLARALGPQGRGAAAYVTLLDEVTSLVFSVGLPTAVAFFAKEQVLGLRRALAMTSRAGLALWPLAILLALGADRLLLAGESASLRAVAAFAIGSSPVLGLWGLTVRQLLNANGDLVTARRLPLIQMTARVVLIGSAYVVGVLSPALAVLALIVSFHMSTFYGWLRLRRSAVHEEPGTAEWSQIVRFAARVHPGSIAGLLSARVDQVAIVALLGTRALGLYAVALAINLVPLQLGMALAASATSRVRLADPGGRASQASRRVREAWIYISAFSIAVAIASYVAIEFVFGSAFSSARLPTMILLAGTAAHAIATVAQQVATCLDRPGGAAIAQSLALTTTVAGLLVLVPTLGLPGAAAASALGGLVRLVAVLRVLYRVGVRHVLPTQADLSNVSAQARARVRAVWPMTG